MGGPCLVVHGSGDGTENGVDNCPERDSREQRDHDTRACADRLRLCYRPEPGVPTGAAFPAHDRAADTRRAHSGTSAYVSVHR